MNTYNIKQLLDYNKVYSLRPANSVHFDFFIQIIQIIILWKSFLNLEPFL
jgi:hypothetical protein